MGVVFIAAERGEKRWKLIELAAEKRSQMASL
jgi:hypothetical protein